MDEKTFLKEGVDISKDDFYQWMVDNPDKFPKSSMPSAQDFIDAFTEAAEAGEDVICICITRKFSSAFQTATAAKEMLADTYPDTRITIVDSIMDTVLQGIFVLEVCRMRDAGASYDELLEQMEEIKPTGRIFFTVGNIDYLKHGGRIGKLAGIAGTVLGVRPLIVLKEGEIFSGGITRSRKKSLEKVEKMAIDYINENFKSADEYEIVVGYGYDYNESVPFRDGLEKTLSDMGHEKKIEINHIGAAISVHTGPYPLGVGVLKRGSL
jgi:DegV family protein with EDD domain